MILTAGLTSTPADSKGQTTISGGTAAEDHTSCTGMESMTGFQLLFGSNDCHRIYECKASDQSFDRCGLPLILARSCSPDPTTATTIRRRISGYLAGAGDRPGDGGESSTPLRFLRMKRPSSTLVRAKGGHAADWVGARLVADGVPLRPPGRQPSITDDQVRSSLDQGLRVAEIARNSASPIPGCLTACGTGGGWDRPDGRGDRPGTLHLHQPWTACGSCTSPTGLTIDEVAQRPASPAGA